MQVTKSPCTSTCSPCASCACCVLEFLRRLRTFPPAGPPPPPPVVRAYRPERSVLSSWHSCATDGPPPPPNMLIDNTGSEQSRGVAVLDLRVRPRSGGGTSAGTCNSGAAPSKRRWIPTLFGGHPPIKRRWIPTLFGCPSPILMPECNLRVHQYCTVQLSLLSLPGFSGPDLHFFAEDSGMELRFNGVAWRSYDSRDRTDQDFVALLCSALD